MASIDAINARIATLDRERADLEAALARNMAERTRLAYERDTWQAVAQDARYQAWRAERRRG